MTTPPTDQPSNARGELLDSLADQAEFLLTQPDSHVSISFLQRKLRLRYYDAARIMEELERLGVVTPPDPHDGKRARTNAPTLNARPEMPTNAEPNGSGRPESVVGEAVAAPLGVETGIADDDPRSYLRQILGKFDARQLGGTLWQDAFDSLLRTLPTAAASPPAGEPPSAQQAPPPTGWMPIESAPLDTLLILGWWDFTFDWKPIWCVAAREAGFAKAGTRHGQATHWMPLSVLPPAPEFERPHRSDGGGA